MQDRIIHLRSSLNAALARGDHGLAAACRAEIAQLANASEAVEAESKADEKPAEKSKGAKAA